jgi:hypothetical protein
MKVCNGKVPMCVIFNTTMNLQVTQNQKNLKIAKEMSDFHENPYSMKLEKTRERELKAYL